MRLRLLCAAIAAIGCTHPGSALKSDVPPGPPPISCNPHSWTGKTTFTVACGYVPDAKTRKTAPHAALVEAAKATVAKEAVEFYIQEVQPGPAPDSLVVTGGVVLGPDDLPEGLSASFIGEFLTPDEIHARKLEAREHRCEMALGDRAVPLDEQKACSEFLTWREQVRSRELVLQQMERQHTQALEAQAAQHQAARDEAARRHAHESLMRSLEDQRRAREESARQQQKTWQDFSNSLRSNTPPPATPTTTDCYPTGLGSVRCTTR